jgi:signal transduction histidine kinase
MSRPDFKGGRSLFDKLASTYLSARWFVGGGMVALTAIVIFTDGAGPFLWTVPAAGLVITMHNFAMRSWGLVDARSALVVDVTAGSLAAMAIATSTGDPLPALLTFVGATVLIALFSRGWSKFSLLGYLAAITLGTLAILEEGDFGAALGAFVGTAFIAALILGVISAIRTQLVELEASKAQTIGVVSHELRNHLTGVMGAIELVRDTDIQMSSEEDEEFLGLAYQQASEAGEVIEDLLIASRAERGVLDAMLEVVDLGPLTETVIRRTSMEGSEILFDSRAETVWAMADPLRYKQIVRNLLTNAMRYGGEHIRVSLESREGTVSVIVADDGDGVSSEDEGSLFLAYRGGTSLKGVAGSTGLGLWIARSLAQKMNGHLVYRRQSEQTVFELILPVAPAPSDTRVPAESAISA